MRNPNFNRFFNFVKMFSLFPNSTYSDCPPIIIPHLFAVESYRGPMLAEDVLLDPVQDGCLAAVVEPQHHDPDTGDQGLDQSWTHVKSAKVGD